MRGMVSAPQPEAVEAGLDVLADGGNVVDAAIGAALVQTAVDPQMCGIAGFGSCHIRLAGGPHLLIDFHGRAPAAVRPDMWQDLIVRECDDGFGFVLKGRVNELGYQSATTPMTLRAFDDILRRFGTRSLARLLEPAIALLRGGVRGQAACPRLLDARAAGRTDRPHPRADRGSRDPRDLHQAGRPALWRGRDRAQSGYGPHLPPDRRARGRGFLLGRDRPRASPKTWPRMAG